MGSNSKTYPSGQWFSYLFQQRWYQIGIRVVLALLLLISNIYLCQVVRNWSQVHSSSRCLGHRKWLHPTDYFGMWSRVYAPRNHLSMPYISYIHVFIAMFSTCVFQCNPTYSRTATEHFLSISVPVATIKTFSNSMALLSASTGYGVRVGMIVLIMCPCSCLNWGWVGGVGWGWVVMIYFGPMRRNYTKCKIKFTAYSWL